MKKVVALKDYSDNYYILREGMIYNLIDSIADQLIEKEVCAASTGSPDDVVITQTVTSGTEIADIKINGQSNKIYTPASSGGSTEVFLITISSQQTEEIGVYTYSANKTFSEIRTAVNNGMVVICKEDQSQYENEAITQYYLLQRFQDNEDSNFQFASFVGIGTTYPATQSRFAAQFVQIIIHGNNTININYINDFVG